MYKITFYVPDTHLELVKAALFNAGAGRVGAYDSCAWQVKGQGQFRPLAGSNPFVGEHGLLEAVDEYKVELVCDDANIQAAIAALKSAHPYEMPAYDVVQLLDL
ncbi:MAG: YqfO family protein [Moraxellaceae bacterium]|jgi:hypothetical protein|nr:YqfO family protein [Moraxellaceae bacterium]MBP8852190.1 YqfO family protein [Moraxellaceae bacterium]MBP9044936.1 YqfO family protein [Moraxellaceae bacterium]MBP9730129.1 YqfO family protein [Moraxellaceae bacterium]HQX89373.1 YqfO family protein [Moraxellaceae bacterium]